MKVGGHSAVSKAAVKYLWVITGAELSFTEHLERITVVLAKMVPNIGGPKNYQRLLLAGMVQSILLHARPVWVETLVNSQRRTPVNLIYRLMPLRVSRTFRTTSNEAILVVVTMIRVDVLAK